MLWCPWLRRVGAVALTLDIQEAGPRRSRGGFAGNPTPAVRHVHCAPALLHLPCIPFASVQTFPLPATAACLRYGPITTTSAKSDLAPPSTHAPGPLPRLARRPLPVYVHVRQRPPRAVVQLGHEVAAVGAQDLVAALTQGRLGPGADTVAWGARRAIHSLTVFTMNNLYTLLLRY